MFQAEPIAWMQGFASPALTWVMTAITTVGYAPVYIGLVIVLLFGFRLRPGFGILTALLLSGILTQSLKSTIALPRPSDIDARVVEPADPSHVPLVQRGGAPAFWALPAREAIMATRARPGRDHGFPSGHVSTAAAFLFACTLFFRSRRGLLAVILWPLFMGLSRMYLGRHFLADVLGGFAVGVLAAGAAAVLLRSLDRGTAAARPAQPLLPIAVVAMVLVLLIPWVPTIDPENTGRLAGAIAAYGIVLASGLPSDRGTVPRRLGRVVAAALVYVALARAVSLVVDTAGWQHARLGTLGAAAVITAGTLLSSVAVARRLHWYVAD